MLQLNAVWFKDNHKFVSWSNESSHLLKNTKDDLYRQTKSQLSRRCSHIAGHGGVKGSIRYCQRLCNNFKYVARFDIQSYYKSMDHNVIRQLLEQCHASQTSIGIVSQYLYMPDYSDTGQGIVAGGSVSPYIGALYLTPLDKVMEQYQDRYGIRYQRFMDDFVIFAPSRHKLKAVIKRMHAILADLKVNLHPKKRFIGTTIRGFDFLGYWLEPNKPLVPSSTSLTRLLNNARQLYEQTADVNRLREYVQRWVHWHRSGLRGLIDKRNRFQRFWLYVINTLNITDKARPL
jgi:RNA-directed DNA polymerase